MTITTGYNIGLAIWPLKCFYETFEQGSTVGIHFSPCGCFHPQAIARTFTLRQVVNEKVVGENINNGSQELAWRRTVDFFDGKLK